MLFVRSIDIMLQYATPASWRMGRSECMLATVTIKNRALAFLVHPAFYEALVDMVLPRDAVFDW